MTEFRQPKTEITLEKAKDGDRQIWVYEEYETVRNIVVDGVQQDTPLVEFERVQGIGKPGIPFATKPKNIINIRDISE